MSKRETIYDTCYAALDASASVSYVTREVNEDPFSWKENQYPAVRLIDGQEVKERFCYPGSTAQMDMKSELTVVYEGYVREYNRSSADLIAAQNNLAAAVETALTGDSTLLGMVADVVPDDLITDKGNADGIGWVSGGFTITYYYNHTAP